MFRKAIPALLAAGLAAGIASAASAAPGIFFGIDQNPGGTVPPAGNTATARASFLSNLTSVGNEDFESFAIGTTPPLVLSFPGSNGNLTATLTSTLNVTVTNQNPVGQYSTSGTKHLDAEFGTTLDIDFSASPISAFGFYGTDISDSGGDLVVDLVDSMNNMSSITVVVDGQNNGSLLFWGFIDTAATYTSISLRNTSSSDRFGFDDMVIGDREQVTLPEAGTLGLLGMSIVALGVAGRRRRS